MPTDKVKLTVLSPESPTVIAMTDRASLLLYNPSKSPVEIGLTCDRDSRQPVASLRLQAGEHVALGPPVWHGPVYLVSGPQLVVTEVLRHDAA